MHLPRLLFFIFLFSSVAVLADDYIVSSSYMEVHTAVGRSQPIYLVIEKNESFSILKKKSDWLKIRSLDGDTGWVSLQSFYAAVGESEYNEKKTYLESDWEFGVAGGAFGSEESYTISAGYYLKPEVLFTAEMMKTSGVYSNSTLGTVNLTLNFYRRFLFSPFLNIGGGVFFNKPRQSLVNAENNTQSAYSYGAGLNVNPYKNINFRFSVQDYYLVDKKTNYFDWRIGIFGVFS